MSSPIGFLAIRLPFHLNHRGLDDPCYEDPGRIFVIGAHNSIRDSFQRSNLDVKSLTPLEVSAIRRIE